jgi:hypothetical protein
MFLGQLNAGQKVSRSGQTFPGGGKENYYFQWIDGFPFQGVTIICSSNFKI